LENFWQEEEAAEAAAEEARREEEAAAAAEALRVQEEEEEAARMKEVTEVWCDLLDEFEAQEAVEAAERHRCRSTESGEWERAEVETLCELRSLQDEIVEATRVRNNAKDAKDAKALAEAQAIMCFDSLETYLSLVTN
jgi:hypothetical protein